MLARSDNLRRAVTLLTLVGILAVLAPAISAQTADKAALDQVSSKQYIVIDDKTGEIYAEKDADKRTGIASLTKVFTAMVAIERAPLNFQITAQDSDVFDTTSTTMTGFAAGNTYTVEDLIYGMLLESGNDAAEALARGIGFKDGDTPQQSVDRFVGWMNDKVTELGLTDTHFTNPHGLSDPKHYSTPRNLAAFMMYAATNATFMTIITARNYTDSLGVAHTSVNRGPEFIASYIGGKTGYDDATGWCLIEFGQRGDAQLVSVTIDGVAPDIWYQDHQILLEYGFAARADRIAAGQAISGDVVSYAVAQTAPTEAPAVAIQATQGPVAQSNQSDTAPHPVLVQGTPEVRANGRSTGRSPFGKWWPALVIVLGVLGLLAYRAGFFANATNKTTDATPPQPPTPPTNDVPPPTASTDEVSTTEIEPPDEN